MTKREVLLAICETPGWSPSETGHVHQYLTELVNEGWIVGRMDGYEAAEKALDEYPAFLDQEDIADATAIAVKALPQADVPDLGGWIEKTLPAIYVRDHQRTEFKLDFETIQGAVIVANEAEQSELREVRITVKSRSIKL